MITKKDTSNVIKLQDNESYRLFKCNNCKRNSMAANNIVSIDCGCGYTMEALE